jgi:ParB family transcriptional regulator, chromosome partitioning protein
MAKKQALGRGFDALIPKDLDDSILMEDKHRVQKVLIADIVPNPEQPRREIEKKALNELTESVKRHGVLQPIIVVSSKDGSGRYRIVAGERRWHAAKAAGMSHMPAIVRSLAELEEIELSLIENIQRVDLSPMEQALSIYKLQQQFNMALDDIASKLGKAPSTVSNLSRLLQLPEAASQALNEGKISEGHARAILALSGNPKKQHELLHCILDNSWTVRQAEQFVLQAKKGATSGSITTQLASETEMTQAVGKLLNTEVKIKRKAKGGHLMVAFKDDNQLEQIAIKLRNID